MKKIAIISAVPSGATTLAKVLAPMIRGEVVHILESIPALTRDPSVIDVSDFRENVETILLNQKPFVLDIGRATLENCLAAIADSQKDLMQEVDAWLIPFTDSEEPHKAFERTDELAGVLAEVGVEAKRIHYILNRASSSRTLTATKTTRRRSTDMVGNLCESWIAEHEVFRKTNPGVNPCDLSDDAHADVKSLLREIQTKKLKSFRLILGTIK